MFLARISPHPLWTPHPKPRSDNDSIGDDLALTSSQFFLWAKFGQMRFSGNLLFAKTAAP
eukprot:926704-Amphidinium_carterae.1